MQHGHGATVSLTALVPFLRLLESEAPTEIMEEARERGEAIFARWGLSTAGLGDNLALRLPHDLVTELLLDFVEVLRDPSAPLRAGRLLRLGDYELLEYLCGTCSTLGECIACLGRYYRLLIDADCTLVIEGDLAHVRFCIRPGLEAPECINEFALASNFWMAALHLRPEDAPLPLEVQFAHAAPAHAAMFADVFFAPVRFDCEHNATVFPVAMLNHPMRTADPILHATLTRLADRELEALDERSAFPSRVRTAIEQELTKGAAMQAVAARLHVSPSALRTRLRQHDTSYLVLLDSLRRELAKRALRQSQRSVSEIAYELGFANPTAFHRAFRRWFGVPPVAYRNAPTDNPTARFWRNVAAGAESRNDS
jgi:AraC-like DNA-binding protein